MCATWKRCNSRAGASVLREWRPGPLLAGGLLLVGAAAVLLPSYSRPPGPIEPAWDRSVCARCGMLISDPHFASQLRTADGDRLQFDDPGCLLTWVGERRPELDGVWFRDYQSNGWIPGAEVVFVPLESVETPMGYGLGAARHAHRQGLDFEAAVAAAFARDEQRHNAANHGR